MFAVQDCGFVARCALEAQDSGEVRITRIKRIIRECAHGIHDISRVELDAATGLPRFNMPLELGLFLGAQEFGGREQKRKRCLILDEIPYRYQVSCSDIAGQDVAAHHASPLRAIAAVRDWFSTWLCGRGVMVPSHNEMRSRFREFSADLAGVCRELRLDLDELLFPELRVLIQEWADEN